MLATLNNPNDITTHFAKLGEKLSGVVIQIKNPCPDHARLYPNPFLLVTAIQATYISVIPFLWVRWRWKQLYKTLELGV